MTTQLELPPAQQHSQTSLAAAKAIAADAPTLRNQVLQYLRQCGSDGATDEQIQFYLDMSANNQRPRRVELVKAGLVVDSGCTRATAAGRKATVWKVTP